MNEEYPFRYESPINEQFYSAECLREAMDGFFYVDEIKRMLEHIEKNGIEDKKENYLESLEKMKGRVPKSKEKELTDMIKTMKAYGQPVEV